MDESWRMRMGGSNSEADRLQPEDFKDVFGGPPRSVMARKLSMDFGSYSSDWFYDEVFKASDADNARRPVTVTVTGGDGHTLPEFFIPEQRRSDDQKKKKKAKSWMSRSKSTSSSVLSFEDEDVPLSSFTSRLRPINVPYRWSSTSTCTSNMGKCKDKKQDLPTFGYSNSKASEDSIHQLERNERTLNSFIFGFPKPSVSTPEINIMSDYHLRSQSPASAISSHHHHHQAHESQNMSKNFSYEDSILYQEETAEVDQDEGSDDVMDSGYVIELNSLSTEANNSEAIDIDEAIAWAKEQFQSLS